MSRRRKPVDSTAHMTIIIECTNGGQHPPREVATFRIATDGRVLTRDGVVIGYGGPSKIPTMEAISLTDQRDDGSASRYRFRCPEPGCPLDIQRRIAELHAELATLLEPGSRRTRRLQI